MTPESPAAARSLLAGENATVRTGFTMPIHHQPIALMIILRRTSCPTNEGVSHAVGVIIKDVDAAVLVTTCSELAVFGL